MNLIIKEDYITLGQLLKITGFASTGGMTKILVKQLNIKVNDEIENRRGRKLYPNDVVLIENQTYLIKDDN